MTQYIEFNEVSLVNWEEMSDEEADELINKLKTTTFTLTPPTVLPDWDYKEMLDSYITSESNPKRGTISYYLDMIKNYSDIYDK